MPILEGRVDAVIGVDTHRDTHAAALLDPNGGVRATLEVPSDRAGHARLLQLAAAQAPGRRVWALEGTGCYGAGLTGFLLDHGEWVVEIDRPKRPRGRNGAKSDALDAIRAGREALAREQLASPRQRGHREAIRVLHTTRTAIVDTGANARRQLKALIITAPEPLRDILRGRTWLQQARACAALVAVPSDPVEHRATVRALRMTAQRVLAARLRPSSSRRNCASSSRSWRRCCSPSAGSDRSAPPRCSSAGHTLAGSAPRPPSRCWAARHRWRPPPARSSAIGSTVAVTGS